MKIQASTSYNQSFGINLQKSAKALTNSYLGEIKFYEGTEKLEQAKKFLREIRGIKVGKRWKIDAAVKYVDGVSKEIYTLERPNRRIEHIASFSTKYVKPLDKIKTLYEKLLKFSVRN